MLTEEQQAVVDVSRQLLPREMLKVDACAGSGKTSTLVEIAKANPHARFLYLAFNRAIVSEAKQRFPANVKIYTTHGLAYYWYAYVYGNERLHDIKPSYKIFDIEPLFPSLGNRELNGLLLEYRDFLYSSLEEPYDKNVAKIFEAVQQGKLPLTHDFYLKLYQLRCQPKFRNYDYVLLDEAQDTNAVTMAIFTDNDCRRILVGDSHQAIYGFRGAINGLNGVQAEHNLNLTHSFRSVQPILDRANWFLNRYDAHNSVPMTSQVEPRTLYHYEAIITRTNAEIIRTIRDLDPQEMGDYFLLRPAEAVFSCALSILAVFYGVGNVYPAYSWLKRFTSKEKLEKYIEDCGDIEIKQNLKLVSDYGPELLNIFSKAQALAANRDATHCITTAHTAKGLEWDRVTLANDFPDLPDCFKKTKQVTKGEAVMSKQSFEQELNLYYVAVTRAKYELEDDTANGAYYDKVLSNTLKRQQMQQTQSQPYFEAHTAFTATTAGDAESDYEADDAEPAESTPPIRVIPGKAQQSSAVSVSTATPKMPQGNAVMFQLLEPESADSLPDSAVVMKRKRGRPRKHPK